MPVQFLALDVWNGNPSQAQSFVNSTGITYPLLRTASSVGNQYASGYDNVFVVDPSGTITLVNLQAFVSGQIMVEIDRLLALTPAPALPSFSFDMSDPYPNPFNPRTQVAFDLDGTGPASVQVSVLDLRGRLVASIWNRDLTRGQRYEVPWNGRNGRGTPVPSGVYQFSITVDGQRQTRPVTLLK